MTLDLCVNWLIYVQIPGVPIMYITQHKYSIERLPEATIGGGKLDTCVTEVLLIGESDIAVRFLTR